MAREPMNKWLARILLFAATGIAIVSAMYLHEVVGIATRTVSALGLTAGIFSLVIHEWREYWKYGRYWLVLLVSVILHVAMLFAVRIYLTEVPLVILGVFATLEFGGISWILITICN